MDLSTTPADSVALADPPPEKKIADIDTQADVMRIADAELFPIS